MNEEKNFQVLMVVKGTTTKEFQRLMEFLLVQMAVMNLQDKSFVAFRALPKSRFKYFILNLKDLIGSIFV